MNSSILVKFPSQLREAGSKDLDQLLVCCVGHERKGFTENGLDGSRGAVSIGQLWLWISFNDLICLQNSVVVLFQGG